jgi:hypothetical protein
MSENQNMLSSKDFQKQFFLGPLCNSDLAFTRETLENGNDFNPDGAPRPAGTFRLASRRLRVQAVRVARGRQTATFPLA